jgi:hypothetical protein
MTYFYSRNVKMKLGTDKEPQPYRVLYINLNKRLNDYYARVPNKKTVKQG